MTVIDYINRKNEIIKRITGLTLVPEEQIQEVPVLELKPENENDADICPYCLYYKKEQDDFDTSCGECPMELHDNQCYELGSTYIEVSNKLNYVYKDTTFIGDIPEIQALVKQFNTSNFPKGDNNV